MGAILRKCREAAEGRGWCVWQTAAWAPLWRQIVADVLGPELQKVKVDDSSFGTAMLTAVGIGWFDSFAQAAEVCVRIDSVSKPDPANHALYETLFEKYKAIHDALAPIYRG